MRRDERHDRRDRMRVVPAVDPDRFLIALDFLQPSAPACRRDAALDRFVRDLRQQRRQLLCRAHRKRCIPFLEIARKGSGVSRRHNMERIPEQRSAMPEDAEDARIVVRRQHDRAAVDHACLFAGDLANGRAEELGVIEADRGDERGERADDIRRIEAASHADFEHHHVALGILKTNEREQGQSLEIRRDDVCAIGGSAELFDGG